MAKLNMRFALNAQPFVETVIEQKSPPAEVKPQKWLCRFLNWIKKFFSC